MKESTASLKQNCKRLVDENLKLEEANDGLQMTLQGLNGKLNAQEKRIEMLLKTTAMASLKAAAYKEMFWEITGVYDGKPKSPAADTDSRSIDSDDEEMPDLPGV